MSNVVFYCWCHSDSASVLLYFTFSSIEDFSLIYGTFNLDISYLLDVVGLLSALCSVSRILVTSRL